ncbi:MAG: NAD(P)H-hydrate dehydratase [Leptolyngbya sp. PLA3]|nr:MAG: NAD(P)H-hydrate dehydratase [Cyanobacteria bacterium CYA]MCE7969867.1 NAD(P)H-hydrate dehydratase [Leptolyngbya sp. PL-A3]
MERVDTPASLPARPSAGHKGTFGTALIVGGCAQATRMIGAPALAAVAAARAGAGLTRVLAPEPIINEILGIAAHATGVAVACDAGGMMDAQAAITAFDGQLEACQAIAIGPGLGLDATTRALAMRAAGQQRVAAVMDADALNALAEAREYWLDLRGQLILTPHPGEFRRLAAPLGITFDPTKADARADAAGEMARRLGAIVVLKGARTVVSDGQRVWTSDAAHACLATGGTGDVLAGLIAGLVAQHPPSPLPAMTGPARGPGLFDLACIAVEAHARAAAAWTQQHGADAGLLPMELADLLPAAVASLRA